MVDQKKTSTPKQNEKKVPQFSAGIDIQTSSTMYIDEEWWDMGCAQCEMSVAHIRYKLNEMYIYIPRESLKMTFNQICEDMDALNTFLSQKEWRYVSDPSGSHELFFSHDKESHDLIIVRKISQ